MPALSELLDGPDRLMRGSAEALARRLGAARDARCAGVYVPGRVEFLGRHTDYAGGRTVVLALDRGFRLAAAPRADDFLRVVAAAEPDDVQQFAFGETPAFEAGHWVNYVATVARRVHRNFSSATTLRGADVAFASDLSIAAGMSSSSALMVATFLAVRAVNRLHATGPYRREIRSDIQLAEYLGCTENGQSYGSLTGEAGVGTFGGSEDHTAMLCCKAGMLSQFSYAPSVWERDIPFPEGLSLIVAASGVQAVKTAEAMEQYNRASLRARKATGAYNRATGRQCRHFREIAEAVGPAGLGEALEAIGRGAADDERDLDLPGRFECFYREDQQIIPAVGDALLAGRLETLGELFDASHAGARLGLRNQIPETDFLQASARRLGAVAASAFGAGFGGSVLALVPAERGDAFTEAWRRDYLQTYPRHAERAEFFRARPGRAADVTAP